MSLDGYLAREGGEVDWLMWSNETAKLMGEYWPRVDTILMGRRTYEFALENPPSGEAGRLYANMSTYVFSRTLPAGERDGVTVIGEDAVGIVHELKERDGGEICLMGGGDLAKTFLEAGLVDEVGFTVHPVILGSGLPAFHPMANQINLQLMEARPFANGCVYVMYRVVG